MTSRQVIVERIISLFLSSFVRVGKVHEVGAVRNATVARMNAVLLAAIEEECGVLGI